MILRNSKGQFIKGSISHNRGKTKENYKPLKKASKKQEGKHKIHIKPSNQKIMFSMIRIFGTPAYCKCGCNKEIIIKSWHKNSGIPSYYNGHSNRINSFMKGKKHTEESKRKMSLKALNYSLERSKLMKSNNPMKNPEIVKKNRGIFKKGNIPPYKGKKNPLASIRQLTNNTAKFCRNPSKPQLYAYNYFVKLFYWTEVLINYKIPKTNKGNYYLDIAIPKYKLNIEIDNNFWHSTYHKDSDKIRDNYLQNIGWKIIRYTTEII